MRAVRMDHLQQVQLKTKSGKLLATVYYQVHQAVVSKRRRTVLYIEQAYADHVILKAD